MPYDFTGGGSNDINWPTALALVTDNLSSFVCGWWRPAALTTGLYLWSQGNVTGLAMGASDTLVFTADNVTTDGVWTAAATGLVVDEWRFIALLNSAENTTVAGAVRVWTGDINTAPVERTVTNTTVRSGNYTANGTFYVGNRGTSATLAFGGQVADVSIMVTSSGYGIAHPFEIATSGVIADAEAARFFEKMVLPLWLGDTHVMWARPFTSTNTNYVVWHNSLDLGAAVISNQTYPTAITINGATWSQVGAPRPRHGPDMFPVPRR